MGHVAGGTWATWEHRNTLWFQLKEKSMLSERSKDPSEVLRQEASLPACSQYELNLELQAGVFLGPRGGRDSMGATPGSLPCCFLTPLPLL